MKIVIEEYANVDETFQNIKNIKVGSMTLNDLFGQDLKVIETALNDYEEDKKELIAEQHRLFDLAKEQENELKELREFARIVVEKSVDIDILKSYIHCDKLNGKDFDYNKYKTYNYAIFSKQKLKQTEFDLIKKVVEKYGK